MADRIDISISIRDFHPPPKDCKSRLVVCALFDNDTDKEENWRLIGNSIPCPIQSAIFFNEAFAYDFVFEKTQLIKVNVCAYTHHDRYYEHDEKTLATAIFKVDELIGSFGMQLRKQLLDSCPVESVLQLGPSRQSSFSALGSLYIEATLPIKKQPIIMQFTGRNIDRRDLLWDETAVFFRVFRVEDNVDSDDVRIELYESESIKNHSHPVWKDFSIEVHDVADDRNRLLEVCVLYRDVDGSEGNIGKFLTTYAKMKYGAGPDNVYKVINEQKKVAKKNYDSSGVFELTKFTDVSFYSFLDYIVSGSQLHYSVAIDFSEERGSYPSVAEKNRDETLLQMGIRGIGMILRDYTPNRMFPAFGFAARLAPLAEESYDFNLNFSPDPVCLGLDGVVESYKKAQGLVAPMDTAKCAKVIQRMIKQTTESESVGQKGLHYHVCAIFTKGGPIDDWKETLAALTSVSSHPMSILIVGVGVGDFSAVQKMVRKSKEAQKDTRQCVEFVELHKIVDLTMSLITNRQRIAEFALKNIPSQMVAYLHGHSISAKPPIQVCRSPLFHSSLLIPDRPSEFAFDDETALVESVMERGRNGSISGRSRSTVISPQIGGARRGSEGQYLHVNPDSLMKELGLLTVRLPERSRSVLNTSREQFMMRHAARKKEREQRELHRQQQIELRP